ncbi:MAG TPA: hypothetical protein DEB46_05625 [Myxococcales bacterium]|nr:hypothetical protein [Myxococcales bacterium]
MLRSRFLLHCLFLILGACTVPSPSVDAGAVDASITAQDAGKPIDSGPEICRRDGECIEGICEDRVCVEPFCRSHGECEEDERCFQGRCVDRVSAVWGFRLERRYPEAIASHRSEAMGMSMGYGFGGALVDHDGDGDLDLYLTSRVPDAEGFSPPCLYTNQSVAGSLDFRPTPGECEPLGPEADIPLSAMAFDLGGDGSHELLVLATGLSLTLRDGDRVHRLHDLLEADDPRRACTPGAALATDLNFDGLLDLAVGCQANRGMGSPTSPALQNLFFRQTESGFALMPEFAAEPMVDGGSTLGLAQRDLNDDGLPDLLVINDTGTPHGSRNQNLPGYVLYRCDPRDECLYTRTFFATGDDAWGSLMGVGSLQLDGLGEHLVITDQGSKRLIDMSQSPPVDRADEYGIALPQSGAHILYSWGVVVDDFDRDGLDDVLISQGAVPEGAAGSPLAHYDALMLQRPGAEFVVLSEEIGLSAHDSLDAANEEDVYAPRAVMKADLDGDGYLDLVELALGGVPRVYAEVPLADGRPPRCTIIPKARIVPAFGAGIGLAEQDQEVFHYREIQGQLRAGMSPWLISASGRGRLRFPSGFIAPFDCAGGQGPVVVQEPDWLRIDRSADRITVTTQGENDLVEVLFQGRDDLRVLQPTGPGEWQSSGEIPALPVMVRLDGRWVPRWFD